MTTERTVVQFVCFDTSITRENFIANWGPFANSFLGLGLERIVLAECISSAGANPSYKFISRNEWPETAFSQAVRLGRVGDGGGGPVMALQGGVFSSQDTVLSKANFEQEKVIGLLRSATNDLPDLKKLVTTGFASSPDLKLSIFQTDSLSQGQRFDLVVEIYTPKGTGLALRDHLARTVAELIDPARSSIEVYQEVLTLPQSGLGGASNASK